MNNYDDKQLREATNSLPPSKCEIEESIGSTGEFIGSDGAQHIELGFRPRGVIIRPAQEEE